MIVCLGWGSLIWEPRDLMVETAWKRNGPEVSVEFTRQSRDGRLTLVVEPSAPSLKVLWASMNTLSLEEAIESLRNREGTSKKYIGCWYPTTAEPVQIPGLSDWASSVEADAVIWTALPSKFNGENDVVPSLCQALEYLGSLKSDAKKLAENYIRKAPVQIRTPYRIAFEQEFGWEPESEK